MDRNNSTTPEREKGQHIRFEDRCSIKTCKKLELSLRKTAEIVGCAASTVLNELRRGTGLRNGNLDINATVINSSKFFELSTACFSASFS